MKYMDADGSSASSRKMGEKSFVRVTSFGKLQYSFYSAQLYEYQQIANFTNL